jgi:hypothetical protein
MRAEVLDEIEFPRERIWRSAAAARDASLAVDLA